MATYLLLYRVSKAESIEVATAFQLKFAPETLSFKTREEGQGVAYPPPFVQARPLSQKSRQTSGSTPTPSLDRPVLARNTHDSKARQVTGMPGVAMLAMAENHIKTNSMGLPGAIQGTSLW